MSSLIKVALLASISGVGLLCYAVAVQIVGISVHSPSWQPFTVGGVCALVACVIVVGSVSAINFFTHRRGSESDESGHG